VGTNSSHLDDETLVYSLDSESESAVSSEAVISSLKELREALELASDIASEENSTVEAFIETLRGMEVPISRISIDTTLLPGRLGPIEDARINPEGGLIITSPEGGIETVDLTRFDNRDLFVSILGDLLEKLRGVVEGTQILPEFPADEPDVEITVIDEPVIEEPSEIEEVVEPESPEELALLVEEIDEHEEVQIPVEPEPVDEYVEEVSPPLPEFMEYEPSATPQAPEEPAPVPTVLSDSALRRFRAKVRRQKGEASRSISEIRKMREAQIERMRTGDKESWIHEEGILVSLKKLLSRKFKKK
jgi:hypothetical protein